MSPRGKDEMKRQIEIDDTLQSDLDGITEEILDLATDYLKDNPDTEWSDPSDMMSDLDYNGGIHEIVDSAVPIYYSNIDDLRYLYGREFDQAYADAGIGDGTEDNHAAVTIYCYYSQHAFGDAAWEVFDKLMPDEE